MSHETEIEKYQECVNRLTRIRSSIDEELKELNRNIEHHSSQIQIAKIEFNAKQAALTGCATGDCG